METENNYHQATIELLINKNLIVDFEKAAKQTLTRRTFNMWLKCVLKSIDLNHIEEFWQLLAEFNNNWESFQRTLWQLQPPAD
jgi:hypothetical protein